MAEGALTIKIAYEKTLLKILSTSQAKEDIP